MRFFRAESAEITWRPCLGYLLRHRDRIFDQDFIDQVKTMGLKQVLSAPRSPWQSAYVEGVIGTIRRECLDHMIVLGERCLYRHLQYFVVYYNPLLSKISSELVFWTG
jgi:transposase InsO family protein